MIILALFIFLLGVATEEYIYGLIFAALVYLFDNNKKLQSRISSLEKKHLKQLDLEHTNSVLNTQDNIQENDSLNENLTSPQTPSYQTSTCKSTDGETQITRKDFKQPQADTIKTIKVHQNSFVQGMVKKLFEPILSAILGPFSTLISAFKKVYLNYKQQGKAPVFFLTLAGILTLVMGFGYLLQFSFNEYLPPLGKVSIGYISAFIILIFALKLHQSRKDMAEYATSLIGLSIILCYLCSYFLGPYYQLLSDLNTFILLALFSASGYVLSKIYETRILAFISLIGGSLAPVFLTSVIHHAPLLYLSFLLLICICALVIALSIRWQLLAQLGLILSLALVEYVLSQADIQKLIVAILILHLFFYKICVSLYFQWQKFKVSRQSCLIQLCMSLAFMLLALEQVSSSSQQYGLLLLLNGVVTALIFILSKYSILKAFINKDVKTICLLVCGFFTGTAILVLISTDLLSLVWGIEGLILLYLGLRFNYYSVRFEAYLLLLVSSLTASFKTFMWFYDALAPLPYLLTLNFNLGYLNLISLGIISFLIPILLNKQNLIRYKEKVLKNYLNQFSFCLLSLLFMTTIACIYHPGFWLFALIPLFTLIFISRKFNWPKIEKVALMHWLILLIPIIASGLYVDSFFFKEQTLVGKIAQVEAFVALWLIACAYRKFFEKSQLFKVAQTLDTSFFIILPICFLPTIYRQSPEIIPLVLWASALISSVIFYKLQRTSLWIMAKILMLIAALTSIYACYLVRFENWQGHGLTALILGNLLLLTLLLFSKSFSHQVHRASNIFKNKIASLFAPICIFWGLSIFIFVFGVSNSIYYALLCAIVYCYTLVIWPVFSNRMKVYYGVIHKCIWLKALLLLLVLWLDSNQTPNLISILLIYIPLLISVFYISYTSKPLAVLTRRLGIKQKTSIVMCHLSLTSFYLSLTYLYESSLANPIISILLVMQGTNLLFHTLKAKYIWLMPMSIGFFVVATSKVLIWDLSGLSILQKVIAFMFIGCILLGSAFQFQKLKTKNT